MLSNFAFARAVPERPDLVASSTKPQNIVYFLVDIYNMLAILSTTFMNNHPKPSPLTRHDLLEILEETGHAQLRALRLLRGSKRGRPKGPAKALSNIDVVMDILTKEKGPLHLDEILRRAQQLHHRHIRRESLVSALTKKVLDHHTFTRTAPNTFDLLHRP